MGTRITGSEFHVFYLQNLEHVCWYLCGPDMGRVELDAFEKEGLAPAPHPEEQGRPFMEAAIARLVKQADMEARRECAQGAEKRPSSTRFWLRASPAGVESLCTVIGSRSDLRGLW